MKTSNGKGDPMTFRAEGRRRYSSKLFATYELEGMGGQHQAPAIYTRGKPRNQRTERWVGLGASLAGHGKSGPSSGLDLRDRRFGDRVITVSRYNDYAIPGVYGNQHRVINSY